jgi:hypothetical protein
MKALLSICISFLLVACEPALINEYVTDTPIETLKLTIVRPNFNDKSVFVQGITNVPTAAELGLVYATKPQPTVVDQKFVLTREQEQSSVVGYTIPNLQTNQRYYFRWYTKQGEAVVYSNQMSTVITAHWSRLPDIPYEGQPMNYGTMTESENDGYRIELFARANLVSESTMRTWFYYSFLDDRKWVTNTYFNSDSRALYAPIYLPYATEYLSFKGGGYFYTPEPRPSYTYQKSFREYRGAALQAYPGADYPTVQFTIGDFLPDLYVLEVGGAYRVWKYQNSAPPSGWELVAGAEFPQKKNLKQLLAFSVGKTGYVLSEDDGSFWAFDSVSKRWQNRKQTPFQNRERGSVITITKGGVYGLGVNPITGEGYRDLWLYDDKNDRWDYLTDYPGEGSASVVAVGRRTRVGFMVGYRTIATPINTSEYAACRDAWIFEPK